ncbi:tetratricopeptide repeat protein [Roseicitreum antarcticum]|uniref:TPR repeat-containing protein n=1 Tax=Roseicitreum antarcticum TaxID=564137 RepID=A0A1H2XJM0_9RHOB|nr:TPR repeat-containing protein [Roseicitreum antarcticum]
MKPLLAAFLAICVLAGCASDRRLADGLQAPALSRDVPVVADTADGLVIGHRLMAAGEYELALRAYYRATAEQGATVDVLSAIGSANLRLGRVGQAEQMLRRALDRDQTFVPALNNLGVVLMEQREWGEARRVFQTAFALDSGRSDEIRENLRLAIAKSENPGYAETEANNLSLVRRGSGRYLLLSAPL